MADGTIIEEIGYLDRVERLSLYPLSIEAIRALNRSGYRVVLVTNQSGIARGFFSEAVVDEVHRHLASLLAEGGAYLNTYYYCPHHPDGHVEAYAGGVRRKPGRALVDRAEAEFGINPARSFVVGDCWLDVQLGAGDRRPRHPGAHRLWRGRRTESDRRFHRRRLVATTGRSRQLDLRYVMRERCCRLRRRRVLVVGDIIADEFIYGQIARVSRECALSEHYITQMVAGGGGNAANNVAALVAAPVWPASSVGTQRGKPLVSGLHPRVERTQIVKGKHYRTPVKTRILLAGISILRSSRWCGSIATASRRCQPRSVACSATRWPGRSATATPRFSRTMAWARHARSHRIREASREKTTPAPILVDSRYRLLEYRGLALVHAQSIGSRAGARRPDWRRPAYPRAGRARCCGEPYCRRCSSRVAGGGMSLFEEESRPCISRSSDRVRWRT